MSLSNSGLGIELETAIIHKTPINVSGKILKQHIENGDKIFAVNNLSDDLEYETVKVLPLHKIRSEVQNLELSTFPNSILTKIRTLRQLLDLKNNAEVHQLIISHINNYEGSAHATEMFEIMTTKFQNVTLKQILLEMKLKKELCLYYIKQTETAKAEIKKYGDIAFPEYSAENFILYSNLNKKTDYTIPETKDNVSIVSGDYLGSYHINITLPYDKNKIFLQDIIYNYLINKKNDNKISYNVHNGTIVKSRYLSLPMSIINDFNKYNAEIKKLEKFLIKNNTKELLQDVIKNRTTLLQHNEKVIISFINKVYSEYPRSKIPRDFLPIKEEFFLHLFREFYRMMPINEQTIKTIKPAILIIELVFHKILKNYHNIEFLTINRELDKFEIFAYIPVPPKRISKIEKYIRTILNGNYDDPTDIAQIINTADKDVNLVRLIYQKILEDETEVMKFHKKLAIMLQYILPLLAALYGSPDRRSLLDNKRYSELSLRLLINGHSFINSTNIADFGIINSRKASIPKNILEKYNVFETSIRGYGADFRNRLRGYALDMGFELRVFDLFPLDRLEELLIFIYLFAEHCRTVGDIDFSGTNNPVLHKTVQNTVIRVLQEGWNAKITTRYKKLVSKQLQLPPLDGNNPETVIHSIYSFLKTKYNKGPIMRNMKIMKLPDKLENINKKQFHKIIKNSKAELLQKILKLYKPNMSMLTFKNTVKTSFSDKIFDEVKEDLEDIYVYLITR